MIKIPRRGKLARGIGGGDTTDTSGDDSTSGPRSSSGSPVSASQRPGVTGRPQSKQNTRSPNDDVTRSMENDFLTLRMIITIIVAGAISKYDRSGNRYLNICW